MSDNPYAHLIELEQQVTRRWLEAVEAHTPQWPISDPTPDVDWSEALKKPLPPGTMQFPREADRMTNQPQMKPSEPQYEDVSAIPDKPHSWGREWDGDYHQGRVCDDCGEYSECDMCHRDAYDGVDCLRVQADDRNDELQRGYRKALERYEAQMDYYRTLTEENQ